MMDKIPKHKILEFPPNICEVIRKEFNLEKPGQMDAAIDLLDEWIRKQTHFTKTDFSREYLERTIIFDKGSVERAKLQMDCLFTMKTSMPYFYDKINAKADFLNLHDYFVDALLPKLTKDNYRIYAGRVLKNGYDSKLFSLAFRFGSLLFEHIKTNDYCAGFIGILDYRDVNILELVAQINIMELNQFMSIITEGYRFRVKAIHIVTPSKAVDLVVRIFKQAMSKKVGDRIHVHSTIESLYTQVSKDVLTSDLGGDLKKTLVDLNNDWVEVLSSEENMNQIREMQQAKVNENLRNGIIKSKEDLLGMPGSFRALVVD